MNNHSNAVIGMIMGTVGGSIVALLLYIFTSNAVFMSVIGFAIAIGVGIGMHYDHKDMKDLS